HTHPRHSVISLSDLLDRLSRALQGRVSRPRFRARMHVMAGAGESGERPGRSAENALLVAAWPQRPEVLSVAYFHSRTSTKRPAIAAAPAIAGETRWVRPL